MSASNVWEFADHHGLIALLMVWCVIGGGYQTIRVLLRGWPPAEEKAK